MKKRYQAPETVCISLNGRTVFLAGSVATSNLDGFGGYGGNSTGGSADSRDSYWDDYE